MTGGPMREPLGTVIVQGIVPWGQINTTQHQTARALAALDWQCVYFDPRVGFGRVQQIEPKRRDTPVLGELAPWLPGKAASLLPPAWRLFSVIRRPWQRPLWLYRTSGPERHVRLGQDMEQHLRPDVVTLEIWDRPTPHEAVAIASSTSSKTVVWAVHQRMNPWDREIQVVPNAADGGLTAHRARSASPLVGYVGSINPWFAFDLVTGVLELLPSVACELIGTPCGLSRPGWRQWSRLIRHPRVRWLGALAHDAAMDRIANWRAGLLPRNEAFGAQESDPLKAMEYFSCGIPCVTSHRGIHERFPDATFYGPTPTAFATACDRAIQVDPELAELCWRHAQRWTWQARARRLLELVGQASRPPEDRERTGAGL